ncbi:hypothetical protein HanRHA438_Chr01g0029581 [Helianthus annuus]|nr:hypothetical protein HanRHA438_Chr01g0029581 [Helianthus annuus]
MWVIRWGRFIRCVRIRIGRDVGFGFGWGGCRTSRSTEWEAQFVEPNMACDIKTVGLSVKAAVTVVVRAVA